MIELSQFTIFPIGGNAELPLQSSAFRIRGASSALSTGPTVGNRLACLEFIFGGVEIVFRSFAAPVLASQSAQFYWSEIGAYYETILGGAAARSFNLPLPTNYLLDGRFKARIFIGGFLPAEDTFHPSSFVIEPFPEIRD